jgi:hypothetical protein
VVVNLSPTLREERRLRVFENKVLKIQVFGPKRDEVTKEWIKLHTEELSDLYLSSNIVRVIRVEMTGMDGACSPYGGEGRRILGFDGET